MYGYHYRGEATVDATELVSFMRTAQMLEISSLCDEKVQVPPQTPAPTHSNTADSLHNFNQSLFSASALPIMTNALRQQGLLTHPALSQLQQLQSQKQQQAVVQHLQQIREQLQASCPQMFLPSGDINVDNMFTKKQGFCSEVQDLTSAKKSKSTSREIVKVPLNFSGIPKNRSKSPIPQARHCESKNEKADCDAALLAMPPPDFVKPLLACKTPSPKALNLTASFPIPETSMPRSVVGSTISCNLNFDHDNKPPDKELNNSSDDDDDSPMDVNDSEKISLESEKIDNDQDTEDSQITDDIEDSFVDPSEDETDERTSDEESSGLRSHAVNLILDRKPDEISKSHSPMRKPNGKPLETQNLDEHDTAVDASINHSLILPTKMISSDSIGGNTLMSATVSGEVVSCDDRNRPSKKLKASFNDE